MKNAVLSVGALLVVLGGVGVMAHHVYETHLSSGYAPILKAALDPHASEADEASYLRSARVAVRTDKDRQTQAKLDKLWMYGTGAFVGSECSAWKAANDLWHQNTESAQNSLAISEANDRLEIQIAEMEHKPRPHSRTAEMRQKELSALSKYTEALKSLLACRDTKGAFAQGEALSLVKELQVTAGVK